MDGAVPEVTGVSPCEGYPNTKIKIWGENLGLSAADVIGVKVCGIECLDSVEWISERKLICTSGNCSGRGRIIVETITGGRGTCSVYFTGLEHSEPQNPRLDPLTESDKWIEEEWEIFDGFGFGNQPTVTETLPTHKVDPLGVMRGVGSKMSEENIRQLCPDGSGNLLSDNFNPVIYLLENHCSTTFTQLKNGLANLEKEVENSQAAPGNFIRDNLDSFIQCFDTLSDVNTLLIRNESETVSGSITDKVENLLGITTNHADSLFQGLIKRKMKADATRNALTVLQRYRFLFNLPRSIEQNIKNREYEIVTNDYERAKSLFAGTKVTVFTKVLKEVEALVSKLRDDLRRQLLENPSTLEDQKKLIKYLLDLDYLGDPAWECIVQLNKWILFRYQKCKSVYQHPSIVTTDDFSSSTHIQTSSSASADSRVGGNDSVLLAFGSDANKPQRIQFIEKLIEITSESLPNMWRLGQAYFTRTLFTMMLSENQDNIINDNTTNKGEVFNNMIMTISEMFTDLINAALFEDALESLPEDRVEQLGEWYEFEDNLVENSGPWLPLCVRKIRSCYIMLKSLNLLPGSLELIQQLAVNLRLLCSDTLFARTSKDIDQLHQREDWRIQEEEGIIITGLPVLFENIVVDVLLTLKEIVIEDLFEESDQDCRKPLLDGAVDNFQTLLEHFTQCLEHLAFNLEENLSTEDLNKGSTELVYKPSIEERFLLIWSNAQYTKYHVSPELFDCFTGHGYPECNHVIENFKDALDNLSIKVFEAYIDRKMRPLLNIVSSGLAAGYFQWNTHYWPSSVRSYIQETLMYLIHVHAEVYSISQNAIHSFLSEIFEQLSSHLCDIFTKIDDISEQGQLYAFIEVKLLDEILHQYQSETTKENLLNIYSVVENKDKNAMKKFWNITDDFKDETKFQFKCFQLPKPSSLV